MTNRFNILGFSMPSSRWRATKTCPIHHAVLVPKRKEKQDDTTTISDTWEEGLFCPLCGSCYTEKEAGTEEHYKSMFGPQQSKIITGKKLNKRYYDKQGNQIPADDKDTLDLIAQGYNITYYHEEKQEDNKPGRKKIIR
jgi:hypothetical protein